MVGLRVPEIFGSHQVDLVVGLSVRGLLNGNHPASIVSGSTIGSLSCCKSQAGGFGQSSQQPDETYSCIQLVGRLSLPLYPRWAASVLQ